MWLRHRDSEPSIDPSAYVAPSAVLSGDVRIGPDSRVLHGAVVSADGGAVTIGANSVIMEQAVLRGTPAHPVAVGDHVLVGPHAYLTGCEIADEVFVATGAMVFNGARMGRASRVGLGGAVHIGTQLAAGDNVPIGWIAVGDPARIYAPGDAEPILAGLSDRGGFLPYVFGVEDTGDRGEMMRTTMRRYTRSLARHRDDVEIAPPS
ncbi:MAG TPA: gamma carbonic anhydrase family protein [Jatrophihabitantaceae bacterium]|jgi:carbonic anhydrase/acetyltransferase-like protein (isoleucine patch superfamily)